MKRVLMIAYHFPPLAGSSGIQRTLRFVRYLPDFGWQPIVLTTHPRAYLKVSSDQIADVPSSVEVIRAQAWDTSRHFAIAGRYPAFLSRPDRWVSWWPGGVWDGVRAIKRLKPEVIWSTYPIASAHLIGSTLASRTSLPWVADFRDPMAQADYPTDPATWKRFDEIEHKAVNNASISTFTTPSAIRIYQERYPERADRLRLLENGYDEETFSTAVNEKPLNPDRVTLLHSGIVYPSERDPSKLFEALSKLKCYQSDFFTKLVVRFRAAVHDTLLSEMAHRYEVTEAIEILPPIAYRDALQEMRRADGLLILQAANCNAQIPAKLYEYLRAGKPILVLTDPVGDTARVALNAGIESVVALDDASAIADLLERFVRRPSNKTLAEPGAIAKASRRERTRELAGLLKFAIGAK